MWFLEKNIAEKIEKAVASGMQFDALERADLLAKSSEYGKMKLLGNTALIPIEGVLTEKFDVFAAFFGGGNTTYIDIASSIKEAEENDEVESITFAINSGGGSVNGMFSAMDAIKNANKPTTAIVRNMAASAAYGLASQADEVIATNRGTQFGSVGVAYDTLVYDGDIKKISITSTEAPNKRPDLLTDDGQAVVREQLDDIHGLFVEAIAAGRNTTTKDVNKNYGRGAIVLAEDALKRGMIDAIQASVVNDKPKQTANGGKTAEVRSMDLTQLMIEHPAVYAAAVEEGVKQERDRVVAHLTLGDASGDMKTAVDAVQNGDGMTATIQAKYMAASMNKRDMTARTDDNPDTGKVKTEKPDDSAIADQIADMVCAGLED